MSEAKDVVQQAIDQNPAEISDTVTDLLNNKVKEIINTKRIEVASDYFDNNKDTGADD